MPASPECSICQPRTREEEQLGASKNRRERVEGKAHGAQDTRPIESIGEGASAAQRKPLAAQQVFRGALKKGGKGVWGEAPMPPNAAVKDADIETLVKWILAGAK